MAGATRRGIIRVGAALLRAILSFAYWLGVATVLYGLTAGDRAPGAAPPGWWEQYGAPWTAIAVAILLYAALDLAWSAGRRLAARP